MLRFNCMSCCTIATRQYAQIHVAIITYCLVAILEHDLKLDRPVFEVMRILGSSLLVKDDLLELFNGRQDDMDDSGQLELNFKC